MTKFVVAGRETRDGGAREQCYAVIECGDKLKEIYDALKEHGLIDYEMEKATVYVISEEFSGKLIVEGPR